MADLGTRTEEDFTRLTEKKCFFLDSKIYQCTTLNLVEDCLAAMRVMIVKKGKVAKVENEDIKFRPFHVTRVVLTLSKSRGFTLEALPSYVLVLICQRT